MSCDHRGRMNCTPGIKRMTIAILLLVVLTATAGLASEPLSYYGFDASTYSPDAQAGLQEILAGRCFHNAVPVGAARLMMRALTAAQKDLGYDPESPEGRFYAAGRLPSPSDRAAGTAPGFGLGESVFVRDGAEVINHNCFACHAGGGEKGTSLGGGKGTSLILNDRAV